MSLQQRQPRIDKLFDINTTKKDFRFHRCFSLNVSKTGLLIASTNDIELSKGDLLHLVIDPWEIFFEQAIACTAFVARFSSCDSVGLEKYKKLIDAPKDINKVFGVFIDYMNPTHRREWEIYIDYLRKSGMV